MSGLESYYNREDDFYSIEIRLRNLDRLFNSFDASPFLEKDLDSEAEAYIVQSVKEFPLRTPLKLVFYLPESNREEAEKVIPDAIRNYFKYRQESAIKELRQILQQGRRFLIIGFIFLAICITISSLISLVNNGAAIDILKEGLLIMGWVAMWRPLEILLYDWFPIYQKKQIFEKLSNIPIEFK